MTFAKTTARRAMRLAFLCGFLAMMLLPGARDVFAASVGVCLKAEAGPLVMSAWEEALRAEFGGNFAIESLSLSQEDILLTLRGPDGETVRIGGVHPRSVTPASEARVLSFRVLSEPCASATRLSGLFPSVDRALVPDIWTPCGTPTPGGPGPRRVDASALPYPLARFLFLLNVAALAAIVLLVLGAARRRP